MESHNVAERVAYCRTDYFGKHEKPVIFAENVRSRTFTRNLIIMDISTFSILFIIQKGKTNQEGRAPILARITINKRMVHISTRQSILPERWLSKECKTVGLTKEEKQLNRFLEDFKGLIYSKYNELLLSGEVITADKLKQAISSKGEKCISLLDLYDDFLQDYARLVGHKTSKRTYDKYVLVRNRLAQYLRESYNLVDMPLRDISPKFIHGFDTFLRTTYNVANNHAMKMMQKFRTIYQTAIDNGWVQKNPFASIKIHFDVVDREFLTKQELVDIIQKPMTSKRLDQVRDVFVFCCFCGLAYCDVAKLTTDNLVDGDDGRTWLRTRRQKTDTPVDVPLLEIPMTILRKYDGQITGDKLLPVPSNQKCNDYLKEIASICGIDKELTFHMARHTFSTTVTLSNGVPIETVSKMLGHRNIRTTQIYAKVIHDKVSADMDALAERLNGTMPPLPPIRETKTVPLAAYSTLSKVAKQVVTRI